MSKGPEKPQQNLRKNASVFFLGCNSYALDLLKMLGKRFQKYFPKLGFLMVMNPMVQSKTSP